MTRKCTGGKMQVLVTIISQRNTLQISIQLHKQRCNSTYCPLQMLSLKIAQSKIQVVSAGAAKCHVYKCVYRIVVMEISVISDPNQDEIACFELKSIKILIEIVKTSYK